MQEGKNKSLSLSALPRRRRRRRQQEGGSSGGRHGSLRPRPAGGPIHVVGRRSHGPQAGAGAGGVPGVLRRRLPSSFTHTTLTHSDIDTFSVCYG